MRRAASATGRRLGERAQRGGADGDRAARAPGRRSALVVHGRPIDDDAEHPGLSGPGRATATRSAGRLASTPRLVGRVEVGVRRVVEERLRGSDRVIPRFEHDRGEVEQHLVEQAGRSVSGATSTRAGHAAVEVDQRVLVEELGVGTGEAGADVPGAGPGRAARRSGGRRAGRACRAGDHDAVESGVGELVPDRRVRVLVGQLAGLARTAAAAPPTPPGCAGPRAARGRVDSRRRRLSSTSVIERTL